MSDSIERITIALNEDEALTRRVEEAWKSGADGASLLKILDEAGVKVSEADVEAALAELSARKVQLIAADQEEVDDSELMRVAGGVVEDGTILGGCTKEFYEQKCASTVESGSWCGSNDSCEIYAKIYTKVGFKPPVL